MLLAFWKQFFKPLRLYGGGGDSGSAAQGQAELQLANISKEQWDYFQNQWLPQAMAAQTTSNNQATSTLNEFNNNLIPQAEQAQKNLTAQAATTQATNNQLSQTDQQLAAEQQRVAGMNIGNAGLATSQAGIAAGEAGTQNAAFNQYGIGDLGKMQAMADYYLSTAGQEQEAGIAAGNVTQQYANANEQAIRAAQQRGINPNSGQMMSVIDQNGINEAAASAAAQTQARQAALSLGWNYNQAAQQAGASIGQQATSNLNTANNSLNTANASLAGANSALTGAGTNTSNASGATGAALGATQAVGSGISNVQNTLSGAQAASGIPLANLGTIASGISGGANSATGAAGQEGNIAGQQAAAQAQQSQANSAGWGSALGAAAGIGAALIMA